MNNEKDSTSQSMLLFIKRRTFYFFGIIIFFRFSHNSEYYAKQTYFSKITIHECFIFPNYRFKKNVGDQLSGVNSWLTPGPMDPINGIY